MHVVREAPRAVDLDDGNPLAVLRLELGIAVDRHLAQLEAELVARRLNTTRRAASQRWQPAAV